MTKKMTKCPQERMANINGNKSGHRLEGGLIREDMERMTYEKREVKT